LGCDALAPLACAKVFQAKDRPLYDPLIVHLPNRAWADRIAVLSPVAQALADAFWPGPLTLVLPRTAIVPDLVTAGQDTVAIRWSAHPVFQEVAEEFGRPIAAPSANRFGRISPTAPEHVLSELNGRIRLIVDGGPCNHGVESTIVLVQEDGLRILRHGPITDRQLAAFGPLVSGNTEVSAPGTLKSHYAPRTPLVFGPAVPGPRHGLLAWDSAGEGYAHVERLSESANLEEAATNLYAAMRRLDEAGLDLIVADSVPEEGLGVAIMERLRKAAARE
jgi:L-threonylcarbamoyladenylate synthase